jgi:hypothetical protein
MNKVNLLLFRGSPRSNIENVEMWNGILPCDKLLIRFVSEYKAYKRAREEFIARPEYTHLVIATDDIVVHPKHIERLQKALEKEDYPVLSGYMNVNQNDTKDMNVCRTIGMKLRNLRKYVFMQYPEDFPEDEFIPVEFAGFGLTAIRRDIVEGYPIFAADKVFHGMPPHRGASLDFVFCWHCKEEGIPVIVDTGLKMKHLRKSGIHRVNTKAGRCELWRFGKEEAEQLSRAGLD